MLFEKKKIRFFSKILPEDFQLYIKKRINAQSEVLIVHQAPPRGQRLYRTLCCSRCPPEASTQEGQELKARPDTAQTKPYHLTQESRQGMSQTGYQATGYSVSALV